MSLHVAMIKDAIESTHNCRAYHIGSEPVAEFSNERAGDGVVEIFQLVGHPDAKWCYAWICQENDEFVTVLHLPPVDSPESAVKSVIAGKARKAAPNEGGPIIAEEARKDAPNEGFPVIE
jgi:hypothetical protein